MMRIIWYDSNSSWGSTSSTSSSSRRGSSRVVVLVLVVVVGFVVYMYVCMYVNSTKMMINSGGYNGTRDLNPS